MPTQPKPSSKLLIPVALVALLAAGVAVCDFRPNLHLRNAPSIHCSKLKKPDGFASNSSGDNGPIIMPADLTPEQVLEAVPDEVGRYRSSTN